MFILKSPAQPYVAGSKIVVPLDFMDRLGVRTGRLAVEKIHCEVALSVTTVAANTIPGADQYTYISNIRIFDATGTRFYMRGDEARVQMHSEMFAATPDDPATHAASTTQTDTVNFFFNFAQAETARRRWDFAIPVDDVKGGGVEILCPAATAEIFQTGSGASIVSGTYTLYVHVREEWDIEFHARDVREYFPQTIATAMTIPLGGALFRAAFIYKAVQGGGTSVTTVTDISMETYKLLSIPRNVFKQYYLSRGPVKTAQDPFYNDKAFPLMIPRTDAKMTDHLVFPATLLVRGTNTLATPFNIVVHRIAPKDDRVMRDAAVENNVPAGAQPQIKTAGKSARGTGFWQRYGVFMPIKVARAGADSR